jgi:hypothetical protein
MAAVRIPPSDYVLPPTPPPDIDVDLWEQSIDRILDWEPASLGLTHFGEVSDAEAHLDVVRHRLREQAELAREVSAEAFERRIRKAVSEEADAETAKAILQAAPPELQWVGLDRYWQERGERAPGRV